MLYAGNLQEDSAGQVPGNQLPSEDAGVPGVLSLTTPAHITTDATGPSGATVTYPARTACRQAAAGPRSRPLSAPGRSGDPGGPARHLFAASVHVIAHLASIDRSIRGVFACQGHCPDAGRIIVSASAHG